MLASYSACPRQFELAHVENWRLATDSIHLHAGAAFAKGMEVSRKHYFETQNPNESYEAGFDALTEAYGDYCSGSETKSLDRMVGAMDYYFQSYPFDSDQATIAVLNGVPGVEFSFAIPLPINHPDTGEPLLLSGRCDAIVHFAGGLYALDDKTTSQLGASWPKQWDLRGQFQCYAWAMRALGMKPSGTIVRGISILKTKYETAQAIISQPDWKLERWYEQSLRKIYSMIYDYKFGKFGYDLSESCNAYGSCPFKQSCLTSDPENWLSSYYVQKVWNPLHKT
jgi:hypothetical protein